MGNDVSHSLLGVQEHRSDRPLYASCGPVALLETGPFGVQGAHFWPIQSKDSASELEASIPFPALMGSIAEFLVAGPPAISARPSVDAVAGALPEAGGSRELTAGARAPDVAALLVPAMRTAEAAALSENRQVDLSHVFVSSRARTEI
mmetsp:Transcript_7292/g.16542  ORF Transcript_7292/g.16542 Transcript_7292/m.16542 type:complete len:148 (-) Transcript_7292:78-521(-)